MNPFNRRTFLKRGFQHSALAIAATSLWPASGVFAQGAAGAQRRFSLSLNPGMIGVSANQRQAIEYAAEHQFEAVACMAGELAGASDSERRDLQARLESASLSWDAAGLPVDFRQDEDTFKRGLEDLKAQVQAMESVGATRMGTWIMPTHAHLSYRENFALHRDRLRQCADIAGERGVRLGLEYVGPKTLMARDKFSFIRTLKEVRELIAAIDRDNVGVVLDSFHWYCAEDSKEDLLALTDADVVTVDINDAREDLTRDEQVDNTRHLPLATGEIDLKTFMQALVTIGYTGPVRAEPFNQALNDMDDSVALASTRDALRASAALVSAS